MSHPVPAPPPPDVAPVPEALKEPEPRAGRRRLPQLWPELLGMLITFLVIGWIIHRLASPSLPETPPAPAAPAEPQPAK